MTVISFEEFLEKLSNNGIFIEQNGDMYVINGFLRMYPFIDVNGERLITFRFENHRIDDSLVQYIIETVEDTKLIISTFCDYTQNGVLSYIRINAAFNVYTIYFSKRFFVVNGAKIVYVQSLINEVIIFAGVLGR
jgi:hypothetical protein